MLTELGFTNFKSWETFPTVEFGRLTAFFGTNSSGKTSILDLLLLLKQTVESPDRKQTLEFGGEASYVQLGSFLDVVHLHDAARSVSIEVDAELPDQLDVKSTEAPPAEVLFSDSHLRFGTTIAQTKAKRLYVQALFYSFGGQRFQLKKQEADRYDYRLTVEKNKDTSRRFEIKRPQGRPWALPEPEKFHGFPDQIRTYYTNVGFLFDLQLALEGVFQNVYYLGPLRSYPERQYNWTGAQPGDMGKRGEKFVDALLSSRDRGERISRGKGKRRLSLEEYVAHWLKTLGLVESFEINEIAEGTNIYQVRVRKTTKSTPVPLTDVGFGVSQILPVITLCYYVPPRSTVIIEQPEIHLHPSVQAGLADVLIDAMQVRGIQILLESHSEYLLRRLQRRIAEQSVEHEDVRAYFTTNHRGASKLTPLDVDMFGNIRNWPDGFFGDELSEIAAMNDAIIDRKLHA